jgi:hypothetical protein
VAKLSPATSIRRLELYSYKGFRRFTIHFPSSALLVGPNNAGKSTIIHALRGCGHMIDYAFSKPASISRRDKDQWVRAYPFTRDQFSLVTQNIRHEFSPHETRIELFFSNGSALKAVWPAENTDADDSAEPFFYLEAAGGRSPARPAEVRASFCRLGIIPTLSPIESDEQYLTDEHVRRHIDGRLASRHFRNQVYLLQERNSEAGEYDAFIELANKWTPEVKLTYIRKRIGQKGEELDLFYQEKTSRVEKELFWAGDGLQIWFQFLLHMHRLRNASVVILDEPDVFLHADLQRRLVRVLEESEAQTITATHSLEILGETSPETVIWVDRSRSRAVRAPADEVLSQLSDSLGSQFNLRLARALRARAVLFVEGKDMKLLHHVATRIGARDLANEDGLAVVPLEGFSNWDRVPPFKWLVDNLLERAIPVHAFLDRDYRSNLMVDELTAQLREAGVTAHVWKRKELESYFLESPALARVSGATEGWIRSALAEIAEAYEDCVFARMHDARARRDVSAKMHLVDVTEAVRKEFREAWSAVDARIYLCPAKDVLARLNERLAAAGKKPVSFRAVARQMREEEIAQELAGALRRVDRTLRSVA